MLTSAKIMRDLSQNALEKKFQLFLSQLKFIDPQDNKKKSEALPEWALKGTCKGYSFMSIRAHLINEEETTHQQRLHRIADASQNQVIKMGKLLQRYREKLKKKSLNRYHLRAQKLQPNIMKSFTSKEQELLVYAQDLYIFINSLLIAQKPGLIQIEHKGFLSQNDSIDLLKLIPPDQFIVKKSLSEQKDNVVIPIQQEYTIAFNFTKKELIYVLNTIIRDGDAVMIDNPTHSTRLFVRKKNYTVSLSFSDPNDEDGSQKFKSFKTLINQPVFQDATYGKYLSIIIKIFSKETFSRPNPGQLITETLEKRGQNNHINAIKAKGYTALYMAAKEGCDDIVKAALMQGADPRIQSNGFTPAQVAAEKGYTAIVKMLAEYNTDIKKENVKGFATKNHHLDTVKTINACEAELNQIYLSQWEKSYSLSMLARKSTDELKQSAEEKTNSNHEISIKILYAIRTKDYELLKSFIRNKLFGDIRKIAIYFAVTANNIDLDLLQLLCEEDAYHGQKSKHRATALLIASETNCPNISEYLLEKFADQFTQDQLGLSLLYLVTNNHFGIAKTLLQKNLDINKTWMIIDKNNPLHLAILKNADLEFIKLLCEKNTQIALQNAHNKTALSLAIEKRNYPAVGYFIQSHSNQFTTEQLEHACKDLIALEEQNAPEELCKTIETFIQNNKLSEEIKLLAQTKQTALRSQIENKDKIAPQEIISRKRGCPWLFNFIEEEEKPSTDKVARTSSFGR